MTEEQYPVHPPVSRLDLRVVFPDDLRDRPVLSVLVDGVELSELHGSHSGFGGFSPDEMLGTPEPIPLETGEWVDPPLSHVSPLVQGTSARRVAIYLCSCGVAGCGVIAPVIATDGNVVTWSDFRDFTGVFDRPDDLADGIEGNALPMEQVRFDALQYQREVARVTGDRSWESPSRVTARVLRAMLAEHDELLRAAGRTLGWVSFIWWEERADRFAIELVRSREPRHQQSLIALAAKYGTPTSRARSIVDRLLRVPVEEWHTRFPYR